MIELHTVPTPNGHKISIMLEEVGLPYNVIPKNILNGDQFKPEFLKLNPNNKCPVIVDTAPDNSEQPITVFESGAILIYLAEKSGQLLPSAPQQRYEALQWLMFQMAGVGPYQGQAHHFIRYAPVEQSYAKERYMNETHRQLRVLDQRFKESEYLTSEYTIADIAVWPWIRALTMIDIHIADQYPNIHRWYTQVEERPGVQKGKDVINGQVYQIPPNTYIPLDKEAFSISFGQKQYENHFE